MEITTDIATTSNTNAPGIITSMKREFHKAAMKGNIDAFRGKDGEQIENILTPNKNTILHVHLINNNSNDVSEIFVEEVLAKQEDENGWVPLHLAALCSSSSMVEVLLRNDSSTAYMRDNKGRTALNIAALRTDPFKMEEVTKTIIENCPDCYELVDDKGSNSIHYTTMEDRILQDAPLVSSMYNEKDDDGNIPLHILAHLAPIYAGREFSCDPLLERRHPRVDTMVGGRVINKHVRKKEVEKRHDEAVDKKKEQHKKDYRDDYDVMASTNAVVAILIATVTFAAGFTLPGGLIQEGKHQGSPILKYNAAFIAFVITDCLSFVLSVCTVLVLFLSSLLRWKKKVYALVLRDCKRLTMEATGFMILAFGTEVYAVLGVSTGFGVRSLLIVLSFFVIFIGFSWRAIVTMRNRQIYLPGYDFLKLRDIQLSDAL
ncbi:ankyrin repeat-containing protein ITN1-like [Prosopis cineraria]|uniref:ankyrin repeat-containing protein ITN1-like n=1 Tax=Prosopis cineraria TaxID=364024 RepID=UPI00240FF459|nr:ankyrin repeat-containing protein ITN1-like [Prosopis cineraria]